MIYVTIKVDQAKAEEIRDFYKAKEITDKPYEYFLVSHCGITIHAYKNRKEIYSIVFSGPEASKEEALQFSKTLTIKEIDENKPKQKDAYYQGWEDLSYQIGSDEVGVGDFFGPLIVAASFVEPKDIPFLENLKINDSKKMDDNYILEVGPKLKKSIKNYIIMVSANKLSNLEEKSFKLHKVMAKCHNLSQQGLIEKYGISEETIVYIDQFEPEANYRKLVGDEIVSNPLYFRTKGESYFPSVAVASVLARYTFLKQWEEMEKVLGCSIPKGASSQVDKTFSLIKKQVGNEVVDKYVKRFFRNYRED
ncbi:MAG: ribonuclease HIII [Bacilli bacterium]